MYYSWFKEFLEAGKRRPAGDTRRARRRPATVKALCHEAQALKEVVAEQALEQSRLPARAQKPHIVRPQLSAGRRRTAGGTFIEHYNNRCYHETLGKAPQPTSIMEGRSPSCANGNKSSAKPSQERRLCHSRAKTSVNSDSQLSQSIRLGQTGAQ
jgi:hypothetical protein